MSEGFSIPKFKDGNGTQFMRKLDRYLRYEVDLEKFESKKREIQCGKENETGGMSDGLGQLKATIPARDYFRWMAYLPDCWTDRQFVAEYLRDNPATKAKSVDKKTFQGAVV